MDFGDMPISTAFGARNLDRNGHGDNSLHESLGLSNHQAYIAFEEYTDLMRIVH